MLSQQTFTKSVKLAAESYKTANGEPAFTIPWDSIFEWLMKLLGGCFPTLTSGAALKSRAASTAEDDNRWLNLHIRLALRSEGMTWRRHNGPGIVKAVKESVSKSDEADLDNIVNGAFEWDT